MSEKLCLKWNDFHESVITAFGSLREDKEFTDVTLACEDGRQIEVHKVILAASSPFFQNILNKNVKKYHHPLIYMKGVRIEDLSAIIDFLYLGEANVFQESLDSFLGIAEELKLKGLTKQAEHIETKGGVYYAQSLNTNSSYKKEEEIMETESRSLAKVSANFATEAADERRISIPNFTSGNLQVLDEKVKSMMETSTNILPNGRSAKLCKVCGKEGQSMAIRDHIEAHHLEGVSLPCNICGKECRSRQILRKHTCLPK